MAEVAEKVVTAAEFELMPSRRDGGKVELVRGRVVVMPPVGPEHGERATSLILELGGFVVARGLGRVRAETGYWLGADPDHICAPDISFVREDRVAMETVYRGAVQQIPDLAVEIISPSDRDTDVQDKVQAYLDAGVPRVWVVRPPLRTITVHRPDRDPHVFRVGDELTSEDAAFPGTGFMLPISTLFPR